MIEQHPIICGVIWAVGCLAVWIFEFFYDDGDAMPLIGSILIGLAWPLVLLTAIWCWAVCSIVLKPLDRVTEWRRGWLLRRRIARAAVEASRAAKPIDDTGEYARTDLEEAARELVEAKAVEQREFEERSKLYRESHCASCGQPIQPKEKAVS